MQLRYVVPVLIFALLGAGLVYALSTFQSGKKNPATVPSVLVGKSAPDFALPAPEGFPQGLAAADLKGKVSVVNVFASWCPPCHVEHPVLLDLAKDKSIQLVGLNWKDKDEKLAAWFKEAGNPFARIGADRNGRVAIDWGVSGAPETYIVDRAGMVRWAWRGPLTPEIVRDEMRPVIRALQK